MTIQVNGLSTRMGRIRQLYFCDDGTLLFTSSGRLTPSNPKAAFSGDPVPDYFWAWTAGGPENVGEPEG